MMFIDDFFHQGRFFLLFLYHVLATFRVNNSGIRGLIYAQRNAMSLEVH